MKWLNKLRSKRAYRKNEKLTVIGLANYSRLLAEVAPLDKPEVLSMTREYRLLSDLSTVKDMELWTDGRKDRWEKLQARTEEMIDKVVAAR